MMPFCLIAFQGSIGPIGPVGPSGNPGPMVRLYLHNGYFPLISL